MLSVKLHPTNKHITVTGLKLRHISICLLLTFLSILKSGAQGVFTTIASGNWNAITTWNLTSGTDADGIPDFDDNVTINSTHLVTLTANAAVNNLSIPVLGTGARLAIASNILDVYGTVGAAAPGWSNNIITTTTGRMRFVGVSRPLFSANWDAAPDSWRVEIALNAGAIGTMTTNFKAGDLIVSSGTFQVGVPGNYKELRIDKTVNGQGTMSIAAGSTVITGRCGERSTGVATYCQSISVNGTLEIHGTVLSGSTININNGGLLLIRKVTPASGLTGNPGAQVFSYAAGSTLEYSFDPTAATRVTTGVEISRASGSNVYNVTCNNPQGISVAANFTVAGTYRLVQGNTLGASVISYGPNGTLNYNGTAAQNAAYTSNSEIEFPATSGPANLTINNAAGVTQRSARTLPLVLDLTLGKLTTTAANLLTMAAGSSVINVSNSSFINGPIQKQGATAFTFPVGKNSDYQPIGMSAGGAGGPVTFWTETFSNSCGSGCLLPYNGPNGTWTNFDPSFNDVECNKWFISGAECGNAPGNCGSVCGATDPSLHIGADDGFFYDPGAAYDAGGFCPFICVITDHRAESPTINCTGYSNITLAFNYIENGSGTVDNATLWYFDGSAWSQLFDMAKTATGCGGQGIWTAYSIVLPASANNNANVKIAFRWVNNDDGAGTDPSFAVDDITLSVAGGVETYTAEYFHANPQSTFNNVVNAPLNHISQCEYWTLTKQSGTVARNVTLTWDGNSCGVTNLPTMTTAFFNGASWDDKGNPPGVGTTAAGTITSNALTVFGTFTLASRDAQNPLPVQWLSFNAFKKEKSVDLAWTTASEKNNDYFTIQRTVNGLQFEDLFKVPGKGTTSQISNYSATDFNPLLGLSYYRIKQTDFNGHFSLSDLVPIRFGSSVFNLTVASNQNSNEVLLNVTSSSNEKIKIEIYDPLGQLIYSGTITANSPEAIPLRKPASGIFLLKAQQNENITVKKFLR